jgi:sarcosine oxidase subunit beta
LPKNTASVVIVGAGIQGLSCAYNLIQLGVENVTVLEREAIGAGSSTRSASMIMLQRETAAKVALSIYSYLRYMRFPDEFGLDLQFRRIGFLSVATSVAEHEVRERAALRQRLGIPTIVLSPSEIHEIEPVVKTDDLAVGVFGPDDGFIDVATVLEAFADAVTRHGGTIRVGTEVLGIELSGDRVTGVKTSAGDLSCEYVVNAAGADAKQVGTFVGLDLPIENRRRSILLFGPQEAVRPISPMVEDAENEYYFRPRPGGVLFGLGKEPDGRISREIDPEVVDRARKFAAVRFPALAKMSPTEGWSGIRPLTRDLSPIIGPVAGLDGYINCCGWGGEGIQHAPAGGQLVAEYIAHGESRSLLGEPYLLERFDGSSK